MTDTPDDDRVERPADDDESLRKHGRQLAIDSLLALVLREPQAGAAPRPRQLPSTRWRLPAAMRRHRWVALAAAACIVAASAVVMLQHRLVSPPPQLVRHERDDAAPSARNPGAGKGAPGSEAVLATDWRIEPTGSARYRILAARRVRLDQGELRVTSSSDSAATAGDAPLVIETAAGTTTATATYTNFLIGTHDLESSTPKGSRMFKQLTRVLVVAGIATLSNSSGSVTGASGQLLAAEPDKPPVNLAVKANDTFAFDLYRGVVQHGGNANIVISPYSISSALAMTAEGARGETAGQMGKVLGFPAEARRVGEDAQLIPWNTALIHTGMAKLNDRFNRDDAVIITDADVQKEADRIWQADFATKVYYVAGNAMNLPQVQADWKKRCANLKEEMRARHGKAVDIRIANALWGDKRFPLRKQYVDTISATYRTGGVFPADFTNPEAARQIINQWAQTQTKDKIKDLIPKNELDDNTRLVLTNAIYFKGQWASQFDPKFTQSGDFFVSPDRHVTAKLMTGSMKCRYFADENVQAVELPYAGGDMAMVIFLPRAKDGLAGLEKSLGPEVFAAWLGKMHETSLGVHLPQFTISGASVDIGDTLRAMGMTDAFDYHRANFTGMTSSEGAYAIGKVFHQAFIEVNEEGTVAAAASAVTMMLGGAPPSFIADHPFFFVIRDLKTGSIVFMGHVAEPMQVLKQR